MKRFLIAGIIGQYPAKQDISESHMVMSYEIAGAPRTV